MDKEISLLKAFFFRSPKAAARIIPSPVQPVKKVLNGLLSGVHDGNNLIEAIDYVVDSGYRFTSRDELTRLNRRPHDFPVSLACILAQEGYFFSFSDLRFLDDAKTIAKEMALRGFRFTVDQIFLLNEKTIAEIMVRNGYNFTLDELLRLENRSDVFGVTLAHWMAKFGHRFSMEELVKLGNPAIHYGDLTLLYNYKPETFDEDAFYESDVALFHNGATVAHIMAREGYGFTAEEIFALGDPKDKAGRTIMDWMVLAGTITLV